MSVNRILTRLAVVSCLNNCMQGSPWPTLAGPNIFDSKIEPVEDMAKDRAFPCVVVYTDYDKDHWNKGSGAHRDRLLTVTLELLIVQAAQVNGDGDLDGYRLECPVTDSEIETSLDFLEAQIFDAFGNDSAAAQAFAYLCPSYVNVVSRRGASVEGGQRLAARQITLEMKTNRDPVAGVIPAPIEALLARLETFDDFAERVPELRAAMTAGSGQTHGAKVGRTFGYSNELLDLLGTPKAAMPVLPPQLVFLNQSGGTFP